MSRENYITHTAYLQIMVVGLLLHSVSIFTIGSVLCCFLLFSVNTNRAPPISPKSCIEGGGGGSKSGGGATLLL